MADRDWDSIRLPRTVVADSTTREALSGFAAEDVGRVYRDTDTGFYWVLTATTPTWDRLSFGRSVVGMGTVELTASATTTLTVETWTRIEGTFQLLSTAFSFTLGGAGAIVTYTGAHTALVHAASSVSLDPAGVNNNYAIRYALEGTPVNEHIHTTSSVLNDAALALSSQIQMTTGQTLELLVANYSGSVDCDVTHMSMALMAIA